MLVATLRKKMARSRIESTLTSKSTRSRALSAYASNEGCPLQARRRDASSSRKSADTAPGCPESASATAVYPSGQAREVRTLTIEEISIAWRLMRSTLCERMCCGCRATDTWSGLPEPAVPLWPMSVAEPEKKALLLPTPMPGCTPKNEQKKYWRFERTCEALRRFSSDCLYRIACSTRSFLAVVPNSTARDATLLSRAVSRLTMDLSRPISLCGWGFDATGESSGAGVGDGLLPSSFTSRSASGWPLLGSGVLSTMAAYSRNASVKRRLEYAPH